MRTLICACATIAALVALVLLVGSDPAQAGDRDCSDFSTQKQAQNFFIANGGPGSDPHRLDGDGDGVACESSPCPCSSSTGGGKGGKKKPKVLRLKGRVTRVVDGDTLDVRVKGRGRVRVRLIGIDTPEVYGGAECGGKQASAAMRRNAAGRGVNLKTDPTQDRRDRYGRLLAYVNRRSDGKSLQAIILGKGWAKVYVFNRKFKRLGKFRKAQRRARRGHRGAWRMCGPGF